MPDFEITEVPPSETEGIELNCIVILPEELEMKGYYHEKVNEFKRISRGGEREVTVFVRVFNDETDEPELLKPVPNTDTQKWTLDNFKGYIGPLTGIGN